MKLIDCHVHFWNPNELDYSWLEGIDSLNRSFLPEDYRNANGENEVQGIVFVEASSGNNLQEVEWIETLPAPIKAIVAHASLENPTGLTETLESLSKHARVKGIRRNYQDEAPGFALQPAFIKGVQSLKDYDLSFDICIKSHQLEETIELVKQAPDVNFILDHIAKPNIAGGEFETWQSRLKVLASFDNIACKISGVVTEADHSHWTADQIKPYIIETIEAFGIDRVMFGSDWPVVNLASSFSGWVNALTGIIDQLSPADKQKLFLDNAGRIYRIED